MGKSQHVASSLLKASDGILTGVFLWPTAATLVWGLARAGTSGLPAGEGVASLIPQVLVFEIVLRASRLVALAVHELSHLAVAYVLLVPFARLRLLAGNSAEAEGPTTDLGLPPSARRMLPARLLWQLVPGAPAAGAVVALSPGATKALSVYGPLAEIIVQSAGLVVSFLLPFGVNYLCRVWLAEFAFVAAPAVAGASLVAAGSLLSDLPWLSVPAGCFFCGNWGLLVPRAALEKDGTRSKRELFPTVCESLLLGVLDIVELRGGQAGGVNTFLSAGDGVMAVRSRSLKSKRGHLGPTVFKDFRKTIRDQWLKGVFCCRRLKPLPVVLAQGHSRFGTSSSPAVNETHPHRWVGPHTEIVWQCDNEGRWHRKTIELTTTITHNGDFDGLHLYDKVVPNGSLGLWLSRVLGCTNPAKGDSPKMAGAMDLFICKGMWLAAVRYAYVTEVFKHENEVFGWEPMEESASNTMPARSVLAEWAALFDSQFSANLDKDFFEPTPDALNRLVQDVEHCFDTSNGGASRQQQLEKYSLVGSRVSRFVRRACHNFFNMDMLSAVSTFFARADGTFGVSVSCSLWPSSVVIAVKGQPISLGIDTQRPIVLWSSEPSSLTLGWPSQGSGMRTRAVKHRWDMNDAQGEAIELQVCEGGTARQHADSLQNRKVPGLLKDVHYFPMAPPTAQDAERPFHLLMRGVSLTSAQAVLTEEEFQKRSVVLQTPPPARKAKGVTALDPIAQDLNDVPSVLLSVEDAWMDKSSLNWQSGKKFGQYLVDLLTAKQQGSSPDGTIDVLIFGVENSLWLGQQFAADLKRLFPQLNVTALSSNWLLGMFQQVHGHVEPLNFAISSYSFKLSPGAIVLGVSHSGTTYPTVWAARAVHAQMGRQINMFAMSGVFDTVLANSIGQDLSQPEFTGVLFSTMAGSRPAEASTVATLAMHHTLSWLLYISACTVAAAFPTRTGVRRSKDDPILGKWVDDEGGFLNGSTIDIQDETWCPDSQADRAGTYWVRVVSNKVRWLFQELPDGSSVAYKAIWTDEALAISCVEGREATSKAMDSSADADEYPYSATWTLRRCGQAQVSVPIISVKTADVHDMLPLLRSLIPATEALCSVSRHGVVNAPSDVRQNVLKVGSFLASYLLEGWYGLLLSAIYVYITVTVGFPIFSGIWGVIVNTADVDDEEPWVIVLNYVIAHIDAHLYVFMGAIIITVHRLLTGRRLFTRFCARGVVIVDSTVNYKLLRAYVSKLRSLAFRFTTFGVSGQNASDHFVHEMTHLTTSETIIFAGRPDGRLGSLAATEAANIMSLQQARYIAASPYTGVECISLGHNPWTKPGLFVQEVTLPTEHRPKFFTSELLQSTYGAHAPGDIMYGVSTLAHGDASKAADRTTEAPFSWIRIEDIKSKMKDKNEVSLGGARMIIIEMVNENAEDLMIDAEQFDVDSVLPSESADPTRAMSNPGGLGAASMGLGSASLKRSASKELTAKDTVSSSKIMALLRGSKMEEAVRALQARKATAEAKARRDEQVRRFQLVNGTHGVFQAWAEHAAQENNIKSNARASEFFQKRVSVLSAMGAGGVLQPWRTREEYRQRRRQWKSDKESTMSGKITVESCFRAWKARAEETKSKQKSEVMQIFSPHKHLNQATEMLKHCSPGKQQLTQMQRVSTVSETQAVRIRNMVKKAAQNSSELIIGQHHKPAMRTVSGTEILAELRTMEMLYETRIASAERLLAFYILFHAAVTPISRLWGLSFDMDRSESRLRVASTPAPVPFVEGEGAAE